MDDRTPDGGRASVQLIAEKEKENFYIKRDLSVFHMNFVVVVCEKLSKNRTKWLGQGPDPCVPTLGHGVWSLSQGIGEEDERIY